MVDPKQEGGNKSEEAHRKVVDGKPRKDGVTRVPALHGFSTGDDGHDADKECEKRCDLMVGHDGFSFYASRFLRACTYKSARMMIQIVIRTVIATILSIATTSR